jgi:membrane-associated phospholipid phosphatase
MDELLKAQIAIIIAIQTIPGLQEAARAFTFLGEEQFFILLLPLVYLSINTTLGVRLAYVLLVGASVNSLAKLVLHMPRPYWLDPKVQPLVEEPSYGIPSGHAQNATVVWFFLATLVQRWWAWVLAAVLVLLISFSRIYLGVHFFTDIIAGWLVGAVYLIAFLAIEPRVVRWLAGQSLSMQVAAAFIFSVALVLLGLLTRALVSGVVDPDTWSTWSVESRSVEGMVTNAGALFGIGGGYAMARRWVPIDAGGPLLKRAARFLIGIVVVLILYVGLSAIFPKEPEAVGLPLRFIRYTLMGGAAILFVPWLSLKIGLADRVKAIA